MDQLSRHLHQQKKGLPLAALSFFRALTTMELAADSGHLAHYAL
jgi:hypothetical protein